MPQEKQEYRLVVQGGQGEYTEKKSRFIATVKKVETEQEAMAFIEGVKKKYWDARHNCSAFVLGEAGEITRCSDDGEPSGTAGRPMLEVLLGENIRNVAVVVTRYFGGVLLGTGGLVRAYTQAVKEGLKQSDIKTMRYGVQVLVETDYNGIGKILYLMGQKGITPLSSTYGEGVSLRLQVVSENWPLLEEEMTNLTMGKVKCTIEKELYFLS